MFTGYFSYRGYQVLSITPNSKEQVNWLVNMRENRGNTECNNDWWTEPRKPGIPVDVSISPDCVERMEKMLKIAAMKYDVSIADLGNLIDEERSYRSMVLSYETEGDWNPNIYHTIEEIEERIKWLENMYPDILSRCTLGTTYEGRKIEALVLRKDSSLTRPVIWIDCGVHAREHITIPVCLRALDKLLESFKFIDPNENLLAMYDFFILPIANPDGYVYTWDHDRYWRGNRRPHNCGYGVDPNRNFPIKFDKGCSDPCLCYQTYHGSHAFSEAESKAIKRGVDIIRYEYGEGRIAAFVSIHAFSQIWLSPYGYTREQTKDYSDHMRVMRTSVEALTAVNGTTYTYGPISEVKTEIYRKVCS